MVPQLQNTQHSTWMATNDPLAVHRWNTCLRCPHSFVGKFLGAILGDEKARRCDVCHCLLAAKTRIRFTSCPLRYW